MSRISIIVLSIVLTGSGDAFADAANMTLGELKPKIFQSAGESCQLVEDDGNDCNSSIANVEYDLSYSAWYSGKLPGTFPLNTPRYAPVRITLNYDQSSIYSNQGQFQCLGAQAAEIKKAFQDPSLKKGLPLPTIIKLGFNDFTKNPDLENSSMNDAVNLSGTALYTSGTPTVQAISGEKVLANHISDFGSHFNDHAPQFTSQMQYQFNPNEIGIANDTGDLIPPSALVDIPVSVGVDGQCHFIRSADIIPFILKHSAAAEASYEKALTNYNISNLGKSLQSLNPATNAPGTAAVVQSAQPKSKNPLAGGSVTAPASITAPAN